MVQGRALLLSRNCHSIVEIGAKFGEDGDDRRGFWLEARDAEEVIESWVSVERALRESLKLLSKQIEY